MQRSDSSYMLRALALARRGGRSVRPNPLVGALLVKDGDVVGRGWHRVAGGDHAEIEALREAGANAEGATLYVTLEPCNHSGKTGPCTEAIIAAKVARVVTASADPNPSVPGKGVERLRQSGVEVQTGILEAEAVELNRAWLSWIVSKRPHLSASIVLTLNGAQSDSVSALVKSLVETADGEISSGEIRLKGEASRTFTGAEDWAQKMSQLGAENIQSLFCTDAAVAARLLEAKLLDQLWLIRKAEFGGGKALFAGAPVERLPELELTRAGIFRGESYGIYSVKH